MITNLKRTGLRALLAAGTLAAAGAAQAAHSYIPFSLTLNSGTADQGLWLADVDHLGNPPFQLTNQLLDGNGANTIAVLDDWTLDPATHQTSGVTPQLVVWGQAGHLYKANLRNIQPVQQFSNGSYQELCSLLALDERPYAAAKAYVQAVVEPVGSSGTCAAGTGTQVWLIPANADSSTTPTLEPSNWRVLGAFTDPSDDSFVRWIVWSGNSVDAYKANFSGHTTLLVGPPAGPAPLVFGRQDGDALIMSIADDGTNHTDRLYHVSMAGSGLVSAFSYPDSAPCATFSGGSVVDAATATVDFAEVTATGYAIYAAPLAGTAPAVAYSDSSGTRCGGVSGDTVSGSYVGDVEADLSTAGTRLLGVNEAGPANQTPNVIAAVDSTATLSIRYTIAGHFWVDVITFTDSGDQFSTLVGDGDGTVLQNYPNSRIGDDIWHGFGVATSSIERDVVYLFTPNATPCTGGILTAVDPAAFTTTNISGVPADTCRALAFGWQPASVGFFQESGGSSAIEIDPVGGKAYQLLGVDPNGFFTNVAILQGYPFY